MLAPLFSINPVSYTHLDVYKRQELFRRELLLFATVLVRDVIGLTIREETMVRMRELLFLLFPSLEVAELPILVILAGVSSMYVFFSKKISRAFFSLFFNFTCSYTSFYMYAYATTIDKIRTCLKG